MGVCSTLCGGSLPVARDLEGWIDNTASYVDDDKEYDNSYAKEAVMDSDDSTTRRKVPAKRDVYAGQDVFWKLDPHFAVCKNTALVTEHKAPILPRSFQHHRIQTWLKKHILDQGFDLAKNFQCPPSRCAEDRFSASPRAADDDVNWISYRYMRHSAEGKEVLCRFCHGRNWIRAGNFFRHLFLAHGIMTQIKPGSLSGFAAETLSITDYFTVQIEVIRSVDFSRNLLPLLDVSLMPIPRKCFSKVLSNGFRRTHVLCPRCSRWIRLGWCEYDEIIRQDFEDFDSLRNLNRENYLRISYVQKRDRNSIEGLYENFFVHYIECDFARFQSKTLYVQVVGCMKDKRIFFF